MATTGTLGTAGRQHSLLVPAIITREALMRLKHALVITRLAGRTYDNYFQDKIGDTISIKRPYQAKAVRGETLDDAAMIDKFVTLRVADRWNFSIRTGDMDFTLNVSDFYERYMRTGVEELAYRYDQAGADALANGLHLLDMPMGAAGNELSSKALLDARAHFTEMGIPQNARNYCILNPSDYVEISEEVKDYNNPPMVEQAVRMSYRGQMSTWQLYESTQLPNYEIPAANTNVLVMGAGQSGSSIEVDAVGLTGREPLKRGNLIQFAGVNEIQPRGSRKLTGRPATFVVTEDLVLTNTNARTGTLRISPELIPPGYTVNDPNGGAALDASAFQNVTASPADNAIITRVGGSTTEAKSYRQCFMYEKTALEYVNVQLHNFESATLQENIVDNDTGLAMRLLGGVDVRSALETQRLDVLFGVGVVYPEVGGRMILNDVGSTS